MIKGPWPMSADKTRYVVPLEGPFLTPLFRGERVALRVSAEDHAKLRRGPGCHGTITDLDTGKRYLIDGRPCGQAWCYCDAEIAELPDPVTKRFFELDDDFADYTVVALDLDHAERIMRGAGIEFLDPSVSYDVAKAAGELHWHEKSAEAVARTRVHRQEAGKPDPVPLADCDLGDWFGSEW